MVGPYFASLVLAVAYASNKLACLLARVAYAALARSCEADLSLSLTIRACVGEVSKCAPCVMSLNRGTITNYVQ